MCIRDRFGSVAGIEVNRICDAVDTKADSFIGVGTIEVIEKPGVSFGCHIKRLSPDMAR